MAIARNIKSAKLKSYYGKLSAGCMNDAAYCCEMAMLLETYNAESDSREIELK